MNTKHTANLRIDLFPSKEKPGFWDVHVDGIPHETYRGISLNQLADAIDVLSTSAAKEAGAEKAVLRFGDGSMMSKDIGASHVHDA